jgi:hypothetical protein
MTVLPWDVSRTTRYKLCGDINAKREYAPVVTWEEGEELLARVQSMCEDRIPGAYHLTCSYHAFSYNTPTRSDAHYAVYVKQKTGDFWMYWGERVGTLEVYWAINPAFRPVSRTLTRFKLSQFSQVGDWFDRSIM